jgi:hypothetical protein
VRISLFSFSSNWWHWYDRSFTPTQEACSTLLDLLNQFDGKLYHLVLTSSSILILRYSWWKINRICKSTWPSKHGWSQEFSSESVSGAVFPMNLTNILTFHHTSSMVPATFPSQWAFVQRCHREIPSTELSATVPAGPAWFHHLPQDGRSEWDEV